METFNEKNSTEFIDGENIKERDKERERSEKRLKRIETLSTWYICLILFLNIPWTLLALGVEFIADHIRKWLNGGKEPKRRTKAEIEEEVSRKLRDS